jgi:anti-sigma B factor antagonist
VAHYRTDSLPDAYVVEAHGEIDISNVAELTRRVLEALAEGSTAIVLDLRGVTHLDSSGLAAVISAHQQISETPGGKFALVLDEKRMRRTFELRGLDELLLITDTVDAAIEALRDPGQPSVRPSA